MLNAQCPTRTPTRCGREDGQETSHDQTGTGRAQTRHEIRSGIETDDRHESGKADRLEYPQRRAGECGRKEARATSSAASRRPDRPSSTPTLRLNPISMRPTIIAGMPMSAPATMPNASERHIGHIGGANSGTPTRLAALRHAARGADERDHVAALQLRGWKHRHRRAPPS